MNGDQYDADYFLRGRQTGKSLYEDYRWLPDLTVPMVCRMVAYLGIAADDIVLDFGCARGYVVRALRQAGYCAWGYDVSRWALENADEVAKQFLIANESTLWNDSFDWVIAKDVLEHVQDVSATITSLMDVARVGVFAVVPLSLVDGEFYAVPEYERDVTHLHRMTLATWAGMFAAPGWSVTMAYRVPGIKDNYAAWQCGNGFITARRLPGERCKDRPRRDTYLEVAD